DTKIELPEGWNANAVLRSEDGIVAIGLCVVRAADDGRAWIARGVAEARAKAPSPDLLAHHEREDVRLIEVERAPAFVVDVAALALRDRVRGPAEESMPDLLPQQELETVAPAFTVLDERACLERVGETAPDDEVLHSLVEADDVEVE